MRRILGLCDWIAERMVEEAATDPNISVEGIVLFLKFSFGAAFIIFLGVFLAVRTDWFIHLSPYPVFVLFASMANTVLGWLITGISLIVALFSGLVFVGLVRASLR